MLYFVFRKSMILQEPLSENKKEKEIAGKNWQNFTKDKFCITSQIAFLN